MALATKDALLSASDLVEEVVDLPSVGLQVKVRSLPAQYSNEAITTALKVVTTARGEQQTRMDTAELELLQVLHGLVEPKLNSLEEARVFATKCGPAFKEVVRVIDEISGVDKEAIEQAEARFQGSVGSESGDDVANAPSNGRSRSPVSSGTGD